jgi:hypothetical protein
MFAARLLFVRIAIASLVLVFFTGCTGSRAPEQSEQFFETPGHYPTRPQLARRPRVGVPIPDVKVANGAAEANVSSSAAEELFWTLDHSGRFKLIEHVRLSEMLHQENAVEMIQSGELLHPAALHGIDYLALCHVANLSVRGDDRSDDVSVAHVEQVLRISKPQPHINTNCAVDLKLVEPATGKVVARYQGLFERSCSPEAMNLKFDDPDATWGTLHLTDDQTRQVLRIVLDDAVRRLLPQADALLTKLPPAAPTHESAPTPVSPTTRPSGVPGKSVAARIHCPECGFEVSADDEFCPNCGAKLNKIGSAKPPAKP